MKNTITMLPILTLLMVGLFASQTLADVYSVSPDGNDNGPGSMKQPFRTIQKAIEAAKPTDICYVRLGNYRETVRPLRSGKAGSPIKILAFPEEKVVIKGTEPVTGWQLWKGKIYRAKTNHIFEQLFVDDTMMIEARWPNTGFDLLRPTTAHADGGSATHIEDADLKDPPGTWDGALLHITSGAEWISYTRTVNRHSLGRVEFDEIQFDPKSAFAYKPKEGNPYYLTRKLCALDAPGEWYLDREEGYVYLYCPNGDDPSKHTVEVRVRNLAFDLSNREYIEVGGFHVFGAAVEMNNTAHCMIDNCRFKYISHFVECDAWNTGAHDSGIAIHGHDNIVSNCLIDWSAGNGVSLWGENNTVTNCLIRNVDYSAGDTGAVYASGRGHVVTHNTMYNAGRSVLLHRHLKAGRIEYNHMYNAGLLTHDLGCTYTWGTDGDGTVIAYNWVHDNHAKTGVGIYIDNMSPNHIVHHNVVWNCADSGIRLNTPALNEKVYNNTVYGCKNGFNWWGPDAEQKDDMTGSHIANNLANKPYRFGSGMKLENNVLYDDAFEVAMVNPEAGDFRLRSASACINRGIVIPPYTNGYKGSAPDIGAYEFGGEYWKPGCTIQP